jgi:hypothetical protein
MGIESCTNKAYVRLFEDFKSLLKPISAEVHNVIVSQDAAINAGGTQNADLERVGAVVDTFTLFERIGHSETGFEIDDANVWFFSNAVFQGVPPHIGMCHRSGNGSVFCLSELDVVAGICHPWLVELGVTVEVEELVHAPTNHHISCEHHDDA